MGTHTQHTHTHTHTHTTHTYTTHTHNTHTTHIQSAITARVVTETETLEQLARNYSPADVAEFLREVSMSEYEEAFVEAEVSGEVLLEADLAVLEELGVKSALDQIKVQVLFKRKLKGNQEWCPLSEVLHFLDQNKLSHHAAAFEKNAISGDILLECSDAALKQLGVSSALERVKIRTKFKTFVEKLE